MNETTRKKVFGGALIFALVASAGAVLVTAETDDTTDQPDKDCFEFDRPIGHHQPYYSELTEEQQAEIDELRETMTQNGETFEEIQEAINEKLREFGIDIPTRDEMLYNEIERTTQRLEILERQKELREQGYDWDEIQDMISEEYNITASDFGQSDFMHGPGGHGGPHGRGSFKEPSSSEDTEDTTI